MGSDAALPSRLLLLVSFSAQEGDGLCWSDLEAAGTLSRFASVMMWLAKASKEEDVCQVTDSVLPGLGREEKGLGKVRGKAFLLSASQREVGQPACCTSQADSSGR